MSNAVAIAVMNSTLSSAQADLIRHVDEVVTAAAELSALRADRADPTEAPDVWRCRVQRAVDAALGKLQSTATQLADLAGQYRKQLSKPVPQPAEAT